MRIFGSEIKPKTRSADDHASDFVPWFGKMIKLYERDRLQKFAVITLSLACAVLGYGTFSNRTIVETVIVRTDQLGNPLSAQVATAQELPPLTENEIERVLINITESWRIKGVDLKNERRQFSFVFDHLTPVAATKFTSLVNKGNLYSWIRAGLKNDDKYDPVKDVGDFTTAVEFVSISRIGDKTYQVRYKEFAYDQNGVMFENYLIVINYTVGQYRPSSVETARRNPFGIFVEDISATTEEIK